MKKLLCALLGILLVLSCAWAETTSSPTPAILLITPTPSPVPSGTMFSSEDIIVTLPLGMEILENEEMAGYDAAVQADYPNTARTIFAAASEDHSRILSFAIAQDMPDAAAAAKEASETILGSNACVQTTYGENSFSSFACAIGEDIYNLYFLSSEGKLLIVGACGLNESEIEAMLSGLIF